MRYTALRRLVDLIYPARCMFCGRTFTPDAEPLICPACFGQYSNLDPGVLTLLSGVKCLYVFDYSGDVRSAVLRFKFGGKPQYIKGFMHFIRPVVEEFSDFDLVTWVPVSPFRRLSRTYDQSRVIAEAVSKAIDLPLVKTLRKIKHNRRQSTLSGDKRKQNIVNAFSAVHIDKIKNARILLIDDIVTTGSTLSECAAVLRKAGARDIVCLTIAH